MVTCCDSSFFINSFLWCCWCLTLIGYNDVVSTTPNFEVRVVRLFPGIEIVIGVRKQQIELRPWFAVSLLRTYNLLRIRFLWTQVGGVLVLVCMSSQHIRCTLFLLREHRRPRFFWVFDSINGIMSTGSGRDDPYVMKHCKLLEEASAICPMRMVLATFLKMQSSDF